MFPKLKLSYNVSVTILFSLVALEILFTTFLRSTVFSPVMNGVFLFVISLLIGLYPFITSTEAPHSAKGLSRQSQQFRNYGWWFFAALNFIFWARYLNLYPVSINEPDVISQIETLVKRQQQGAFPYTVIREWGYDFFPTYLPLTWCPFHITEFMMVDYRYLVFGSWLLVLFIFSKQLEEDNNADRSDLFLFLLLQLLFWGYLFASDLSLMRTVELMIGSYYAYFLFSLEKRKWWMIGATLLLCLLSRYSLVLWLPFLVLLLAKKDGVSSVFKWIGVVVTGVCVLYVIPFLIKDFSIFLRGVQTYTIAGIGEWKGQSWQAPGDKPFQLFRGTGLAGYYYDRSSGTVEQKLETYKTIHLVLTLSTVFLLAVWYWLLGKKQKLYIPLVAAAALKIYMAVFYGFVLIPYVYLYIVPLISSVFVLYYIRQQSRISQISV